MIGNQSRLRTGQYLAAAGTAAVLLALAARWAGQGLIGVTPDGMEGHMHMQSEDAGSPAAARPKTVVTPISCEKLPDMPGKSVTTVIVDFPPNAYTPRHRHPGSVSAFVLQGTLRSQLEGSPAGTYTRGTDLVRAARCDPSVRRKRQHDGAGGVAGDLHRRRRLRRADHPGLTAAPPALQPRQ